MGIIRNLELYSNKITAPTRILALSDLHKKLGSTYIVDEIKKRSELNPSKYDCIIIAGDILDNARDIENPHFCKELIEELKQITGDTPTYACYGNHDQMCRDNFNHWIPYQNETIKEVLESTPNIHVLDNQDLYLSNGITITSFAPSIYYYLVAKEEKKVFKKELDLLSRTQLSDNYFNILLTHYPSSIIELSKQQGTCIKENADLVVTGHMHNGLVPNFLQNNSIGKGIISPTHTPLPNNAYGVKRVGNSLFLINGPVSAFADIPIVNKLYGLNCTIINLNPLDEKKLIYKYQ